MPNRTVPSRRTVLPALTWFAFEAVCGTRVCAAPIANTPATVPVRQAATAAPPAPVAVMPLTVLPVGGVIADQPGKGTIQTEAIDPARTPHPEFHFTLRNDTGQPVSIARLRGSCGCETLLLSKAGKPVPAADLAPGEKADINVAVRIAGQHGGLLRKYAWVYGPGDATLATLEIDMTLREPVLFSPAFLNFTGGAQGTARSLPLTVTVDKGDLPDGKIPDLVSTGPDVRVIPDGPAQATERDGQPAVAQKYVVTLGPGAPSGRVSGALHFAVTADGPAGSVSIASSAFSAQSVPVSGEVTGALSALPKTLFFGSVPSGREVTRQVVLTAASADRLRGLTVSSASPWLTAALDAGVSPSQTVRTLSVTLSGRAPDGPIQSQIVVKSDDGDTLVLSVIAQVTGPSPSLRPSRRATKSRG